MEKSLLFLAHVVLNNPIFFSNKIWIYQYVLLHDIILIYSEYET